MQKNTYSSSFSFYTQTLRKPFADSVLQQGKKIWLVYDIKDEGEIIQAGYKIGQGFSALDYEITTLDIKFVNPIKREKQCTRMMLSAISR